MQRELTFYPEIERTRDLLYSEYTSRQRSIHVLLQDNSGPQYRFLLEAFREIVSRYLSMSRIESPVSFLKELAARLDELWLASQITTDDLKSMGLYVLLRGADGYYLVTTRAEDVFVQEDGEALSLSQVPAEMVERIHFDDATLQEELFPNRFKDGFMLFKLDRDYFANRDIVLGCGEKDKSTVLEALSDPLWVSSNERRNTIRSKFITRRVLVLRFDDQWVPAEQSQQVRSRIRSGRRIGLALGVGGAVAVIAGVVWGLTRIIPGDNQSAALERPSRVDTSTDNLELKTEYAAFDTTTLSVSWRRSFENPVTSSAVFHAGWVIFGCRDGNVYVVDKATGESLWTAAMTGGVGASPVVSEGQLVAADYDGNVTAFAVETGDVKWSHKLPNRVVSSPSILDQRVVVGCYDGYAYCLSMTDGTVLWKRQTAAKIRASTSASNGMFFVASYDGFVYALSADSGEVVWRYGLEGQLASAPVSHGDIVIVGSPDGGVHAISVVDGSARWTYQTGGAVKSSPVIDDGLVYVGSNDKNVYCLDANNGSLVWQFKTGDVVLSRPDIEDGVVYVGSYDGYLYGLDSKTGKLLDRFQSDGEIYSSARADRKAVYFGNNSGSFICLNHTTRKTL